MKTKKTNKSKKPVKKTTPKRKAVKKKEYRGGGNICSTMTRLQPEHDKEYMDECW